MTKEALRDAFTAGWNIGKSSGGGPDHAFDEWWMRSNETLDRSSWTPTECSHNSHDYHVDDGDGFLKCVVCKKVLF